MAKRQTRRSSQQVQKDNIKHVLQKNKKLIQRALERYDLMEQEGFTTSIAYLKAKYEGGRFDFDNKSYGEVLSEITRAANFLSSSPSQLESIKKEGRRYERIFGKGQWARTNIYEMTTESTDPEIASRFLNEEAASRAFRAYRNIERMRAAEIVGVGGFGSDVFVGYLYSIELQGKDSYIYGEEALDLRLQQKYGILEDFDDKVYLPSWRQASRKTKQEGDIYDNEW